ncbi:vitamin b6 photo-protection and homoeostasis domain-containing protein [Ditylenchus destructor]|nr:vitamin b6 photo-protection and homoeostasis domain-containing protein [Ditylenchus destructor]
MLCDNEITVEEYNGIPVRRYDHISQFYNPEEIRETSGEDSSSLAELLPSCAYISAHTSKLNITDFYKRFKGLFNEVFLPQGYPHTVTADYVEYQIWDTAQAFASSLTGSLATSAVLKGVGVGSESASVLAASITWLLKDGTGMVGRIIFAWAKGTRLDSECKKWRLVADVLNDIAFFVDLLAPHFSAALFAPCACVSSLLRSIVGVSGGATRTAIVRHQARRDNLADVAAKDGSQETLVNVISLCVSLILLPLVDGKPVIIWALFVIFTIAHLFSNYRAVCSLQLDTLNQARFALCVRKFVTTGKVLSIIECNKMEPLIGQKCPSRSFGCELMSIPHKSPNMVGYREPHGKWLYAFDKSRLKGWVAFSAGLTQEDIFSGIFQLEYFAANEFQTLPADFISKKENLFREAMSQAGWQLHTHQLAVDEWRYRLASDKAKNV